ncbi:hypothetical protein QQ045_028981 [Rhodiola kirilowii]
MTTARILSEVGKVPVVSLIEVLGLSEDGKLSCGFSSFRGKRISMEDFYDVKTSVIDGKPVCLFGVFDGHGGSRAAEYLKEHLFKNLLNHPEFITDTKLAICETYHQTDSDFLNAGRDTYRDDGSTASTAVMVGNHLYVANVGDSRTQLYPNQEKSFVHFILTAIPLSEDHKPNRSTDERKRIENAGGIVMWAGTWRVGGVLAMSRAFGNRMLKQYVVAEPEIQDIQIDQDVELLVVASDGLWDVVSNEDAIALAESEEEPEVAARKLTEAAFARGSCDNITCIVVRFHHNKSTPVTMHPSSPRHEDTPHPTSPEDTEHVASPEHPDTAHSTSPQHPYTTSPQCLDTPHPTSPEHQW